ncbi:hypothetical protein MAR_014509, partial [Mya arenaria]
FFQVMTSMVTGEHNATPRSRIKEGWPAKRSLGAEPRQKCDWRHFPRCIRMCLLLNALLPTFSQHSQHKDATRRAVHLLQTKYGEGSSRDERCAKATSELKMPDYPYGQTTNRKCLA